MPCQNIAIAWTCRFGSELSADREFHISWVVLAKNAMTLSQLQHALSITDYEENVFDPEGVIERDLLTHLCAGLVSIDPKGDKVRLVHYTAQEYFEKSHHKVFPHGQENLAKTCLTYLSFDDFGDGPCANDLELEARMSHYSLVEYAAQHWGSHAKGHPDEELIEGCLRLFRNKKKLEAAAQIMVLPQHRYPGFSQHFPRDISGLHVLAFFGLTQLTNALLDEPGFSPSAVDSNGQTPLHVS